MEEQEPKLPIEVPTYEIPVFKDLNLNPHQVDFLLQVKNYYFWELNLTAIESVNTPNKQAKINSIVSKLQLIEDLIGKNNA